MNELQLKLCDIQGRLFELFVDTEYDPEALVEAFMNGEIAKNVLMVGDPLRAKLLSERYLENSKLISDVRNNYVFTGTYNNKEISIASHGMGNPSMGIYSYELFNFYDVEQIIRVGTIGAFKENISLKDYIVCEKSYTNTNFNNFFEKNGSGFTQATKKLVDNVLKFAKEKNFKLYNGNIMCTDNFYDDSHQQKIAKEKNLLGVEMESAALYINAKNAGKKALTICMVSDNIATGEKLSSDERQMGFDKIFKFVLDMVTQ